MGISSNSPTSANTVVFLTQNSTIVFFPHNSIYVFMKRKLHIYHLVWFYKYRFKIQIISCNYTVKDLNNKTAFFLRKKHKKAFKFIHVAEVKLQFVSRINFFLWNMVQYQVFPERYVWKYDIIQYIGAFLAIEIYLQ